MNSRTNEQHQEETLESAAESATTRSPNEDCPSERALVGDVDRTKCKDHPASITRGGLEQSVSEADPQACSYGNHVVDEDDDLYGSHILDEVEDDDDDLTRAMQESLKDAVLVYDTHSKPPPGEKGGVSDLQRTEPNEDYDADLATALAASLAKLGNVHHQGKYTSSSQNIEGNALRVGAAAPNQSTLSDEANARALDVPFQDMSQLLDSPKQNTVEQEEDYDADLAAAIDASLAVKLGNEDDQKKKPSVMHGQDAKEEADSMKATLYPKPCIGDRAQKQNSKDRTGKELQPTEKDGVPHQQPTEPDKEYDADLAQAIKPSLVELGSVSDDELTKPFAVPIQDTVETVCPMEGITYYWPSCKHAQNLDDLDGPVNECAKSGAEELGLIWRSDADYARALQQQFDLCDQRYTKGLEHVHFASTHTGRAWQLVELVLNLQQEYRLQQTLEQSRLKLQTTPVSYAMKETSWIQAIALDDMIPMAEKLIATQNEYRHQRKPVHVDIGYHWTRLENLGRIQTNGLLTKEERDSKLIRVSNNGSSFGDGIYTANDPYSYCGRYGRICIMVARLRGMLTTKRFHERGDTLVGRNGLVHVLATSGQCIPLMYFYADLIDPEDPDFPGNTWVHQHHVKLQEMVDRVFNQESRDGNTVSFQTPVAKVLCAEDAKHHFDSLNRWREDDRPSLTKPNLF